MMGRRSNDFKFWEEKSPVIRRSSCGNEGEFFELVGDQVGAYSPPLWRTAKHQNGCLSPTSRIRAILDSRRELMERIKDMPESSYELSLKDLVDQQSEVDAEEKEEEVVRHKRENWGPRRAKSANARQLCRSESMESDVFLLKMFVPVSLGSKKKVKPERKQPRKCVGETGEGPEKEAIRDWWKWKNMCSSMRESRSNNISNQTSEKKNKSRGRRGCLF